MRDFCGLGRNRRLLRFRHRGITLPALVFQLDMLNQNGVGIGIKISERLPFRNPAAEDLVGKRELRANA